MKVGRLELLDFLMPHILLRYMLLTGQKTPTVPLY